MSPDPIFGARLVAPAPEDLGLWPQATEGETGTWFAVVHVVPGRVTRLRPLTRAQTQRLEALRAMARLLDSAFEIPGTNIRIGLDPIAGLVPGIGDLVSPLFTIGILWQSRDLNIPRVVQLRMLFNVLIDVVVGIVPVAGDLFDVAWKANDKNYALLERYAHEERTPSAGDWLFVLAMILLVLAIAAIPLLLIGGLAKAIV